MDSDSSRRDNQESKSQSHGESSKPDIMQLEYLKEITNDFSDERILGQGGFGVVYKGVLQNGEMVAVKKLLQPMPNFLKQFKNEVDLLVRLKHPNVVRLIGYCYETQNVHMDYNGKYIFAEVTQSLLCLEFLPKGSLDAYISDESCGLDWRTRYTIIEGICNGLQYLHEQSEPIIHLDLKPANILLTDNMVPKVTDFGLSRLLDQQQTMCTLITTGTRGYMPPEYIQGGTITPMSDIFSLGVIILEVVTGHRDYPDVTRTSSEDFLELTLKKWSDVLEKSPGYTSLEIDRQQIKTCIQIGLICVNPERTKRPTAAEVIKMLQGLESMDYHGGNKVTSSASQSKSGPRELLDIYPLELCFSMDLDKPCLVKITNKTDEYVAFHFKTTRATNKYCIEPSSGFLWPRSPLIVVVTMEERCELPLDLQCHDEFLVQSIIVSMERLVSEHITEDTFTNVSTKEVQKVNLTVVYELQKVVVDASEFGAERFDPKRWINTALGVRHPSEPLDRLLAHAEERLRAAADDAGAALNVQLRDYDFALHSHLASVLQSLSEAEGSSAESLTALARIDTVKQRMEAAYTTLQDAAGLAQLSQCVKDVFSSGDLPKAAETLETMRHCLSEVGEVAEFANVRKQLELLEERLDEMVQPRLLDALFNRKVDAVQYIRGILTCIGRFKSLEVQYTKIHVKPLKKLWEDFYLKQRPSRIEMKKRGGEVTSIPFLSWLPSFYDGTLIYLEQEWKWCSTAFPEEYRSLVPKVLVETLSELNSSFVSRVNLATGDAVPETRLLAKGVLDVLSGNLPKSTKLLNKHLAALIELHNMTGTFARNIQQLFSESDLGVVLNTLKAIYTPYEIFKVRYGQMERAILSAAMAGIDIRGAISRGIGAQGIELSETVRRMEESIPQMIVLLEAAVERCISLTGGSEADELVLALDDVMLQYISNLQETLKSLRTVCGLDNFAHSDASKKDAGLEKKEAPRLVDVSEEEEWSIVQGALQVLTVSDCLTSRTSVFEASLRATLARIGTNFSVSGFGSSMDKSPGGTADDNSGVPLGGRAALDIATIRLTNLPDKSKKLFAVLEQSKDPRFHALPVTSQRVAAFSDKVNELVYDVLISKVRQRLSEIARLPIWSSVEEQGGLPLPSFSAYPQSYVTSVGEYLLTLPQQLEPLAEGISGGETGNDEAQFFATEWIFKVAEGATALFMEQLRGIHYITDRGALQLAADIEYLNNVLSALSMPIPPFLSTFHACISTPRDQVPSLIKSDGGSQLDLPTAHLVSKIRRISLN